MENIEEYLKPTKYCDCDNERIKILAQNIVLNSFDNQEKSIKLFKWVRDNIKYSVGYWNYTALETLEQKNGTCTNKANLLIALCRAINIPAAYGLMYVKGQEYFGPIMLPIFKGKVAKKSVHIYCFIYLNNKWIKCDPSDDKKLCDQTNYFNSTTKLVEWNGINDAMLNLDPSNIIEDTNHPLINIDDLIGKKPRNGKGIVVKVGNVYIDYLREHLTHVNSIIELQNNFFIWLRENHFFYFVLFYIISWYRDLKNK